MTALILDGHLKSALSAARSLGRNGVAVVCGAQRATAPAAHSRFVGSSFVYASPKTDPERFIADVIAAAQQIEQRTGEKPVVYSFSDATTVLLAQASETTDAYLKTVMPSRESMECVQDKLRTYELAQQLSIPTIATFSEPAFEDVQYPAVVKNRHSIVWRNKKAQSGSASFVFSLQELQTVYTSIQETTGEAPLVMEFIQGDEYGIEMVCNEGAVIASFAHRRIRSLSPRGGAAVVKETAEETGAVTLMRQYAQTLVRELRWHGAVMVEFKVDARDGRVLLMEINGRFWGSLPLAVEAGVDFPLMVHALAQGGTPTQIPSVRPARTRHFLGDCKWLMDVLFAHDPLRRVLYPSRAPAIWAFFIEFFISEDDLFAWNDPLPAFYEYIDILNRWRSKA